jgi:hypothetical protein
MLADLFAQIPPFDFLTRADLAWLAEHVHETTVAESTVLCDPADDEYDTVYIVSEGRIAVYLPGQYTTISTTPTAARRNSSCRT